ncbi:hypothetical protein ACFYPN_27795 [Streptomyces sp. NPDC005576]|uniref:hypothetical protein n=1 Tax=unclassified Streptomyces TaxID=2593676 RepID=UPI0033DF3672
MSAERGNATPAEMRKVPGTDHSAPDCSVCQEFDWAEKDAERLGDLSAATDWRILRRRHQAAEHPERAALPGSAPTD